MGDMVSIFDKLPLAQKIKEWVDFSDGPFRIGDIDSDLLIKKEEEKRNRRVILHRLVAQGVIERVLGATGIYQRIDRELKPMNLATAKIEQHWIRLPFGLHDMVTLMPGNLIVVAGEINAGKTAFLLNVVLYNMKESRRRGQYVHYHNSEMDEAELRQRCEKHMAIEKWEWAPYRHKGDFVNKIVPNEINIVDYLAIPEHPWMIGKTMALMTDRVEKGILIIALQKRKTKDDGTGGETTRERSRLYLTLANSSVGGNVITITKAKNLNPDSPYGNPYLYSRRYALAQGIRFKAISDWTPP